MSEHDDILEQRRLKNLANEKWREELKVGDEVMIDTGSWKTRYESFKVSRATKKSVYCVMYRTERRFKRSTGKGIGVNWEIKMPDEENRLNMRRYDAKKTIEMIANKRFGESFNNKSALFLMNIDKLEQAANILSEGLKEILESHNSED